MLLRSLTVVSALCCVFISTRADIHSIVINRGSESEKRIEISKLSEVRFTDTGLDFVLAEESEPVSRSFAEIATIHFMPSISSGMEELETMAADKPIEVYSIDGTRMLHIVAGDGKAEISALPAGIYIMRSGDKVKKFIKR